MCTVIFFIFYFYLSQRPIDVILFYFYKCILLLLFYFYKYISVYYCCYCALVIYFIFFISLFIYIAYSYVFRPSRVCILFPVPLSKSDSLQRERRHFVSLFAKRAASWNGGGTRRFPAEESQSGISRRSTGVPWPPEEGPPRFDADSCGSLARRWKWRRMEEEIEATDTDKRKGEGEDEKKTKRLTALLLSGVNSRDLNAEKAASIFSSLHYFRPLRYICDPEETHGLRVSEMRELCAIA